MYYNETYYTCPVPLPFHAHPEHLYYIMLYCNVAYYIL